MKKVFDVFIFTLTTLHFISCKLDVPIREMMLAKTAITRSIEVKAEKYASDELNAAKDLLMECHTEIANEKLDKAKSLAEKSAIEAQKAIEKSLPLLAADAYTDAKKILDEAYLLYAEKYSPEYFSISDKLLKEASYLNDQKEFWESYIKSTEALKNAEKAKTDSIPHIDLVKEEILTTYSAANNLKSQGGNIYAANDIEKVYEKLEQAKDKAEASQLKYAVPLLDEAKALLANAQETTLRNQSNAKINEAENILVQNKKHPLSTSYKEEIAKAESTILNAKKLHENKDYQNSIGKSEEAISHLTELSSIMTMKEAELKSVAETKLANAKKLLDEKKKSDGTRFSDKINNATTHIDMSEKHLAEKEYHSSIQEAENALAILHEIHAIEEEKEGEVVTKIKYGQEVATYVVKYDPKDRDCLWKISWRTYGHPKFWPLIYVANKDKIRDPDLIFPGQVLVIPIIPERSQTHIQQQKEEKKEKSSQNEIKKMQPDTGETVKQ